MGVLVCGVEWGLCALIFFVGGIITSGICLSSLLSNTHNNTPPHALQTPQNNQAHLVLEEGKVEVALKAVVERRRRRLPKHGVAERERRAGPHLDRLARREVDVHDLF